jgi:hypothetical protein
LLICGVFASSWRLLFLHKRHNDSKIADESTKLQIIGEALHAINMASMSQSLFNERKRRFDLTFVVGKLLAPLLLELVFALANHSYRSSSSD